MNKRKSLFFPGLIGLTILVIAIVALLLNKYPLSFKKPAAIDQEPIININNDNISDDSTEKTDNPAIDKSDLIRVNNISPDQVIQSPLTIEGEARGYWFFEASFPVKLYDENGSLLGMIPAQAEKEWMTEDFVPFKAILNFDNPTGTAGTLVLEKDNPSGLPENEDQLRLPVKFSPVSEKMKIKVFFNNSLMDPEVSCNKVFPVEREVIKTSAVARAALTELLSGVTAAEKASGFFSSLNTDIEIQRLTVENGIAKVDFDEQLEASVGGSCRVAAISAQIRETLLQFPNVKSVIISIDGRTEDILQP